MKKLRIGIDMDGILADFTNHLLDKYTDVHPEENVSEHDITTFDIEQHLKNKDLARSIWYRPGFFSGIPIYEGAADTLNQLQKDGHEIVIITSPSTSWSATEKIQWLAKYFTFLPGKVNFAGEYKIKNLVVTSEKHLVSCDVLIDDFPFNVTEYKRVHPHTFITSLLHAYNREPGLYNFLPTGTRSEQWAQIRDAINHFAGA